MGQSSLRKERRTATRESVKSGEIAPTKRNLSPQEIIELQEMHRLAAGRALEANMVKANTALIPRSGFLGMRDGRAVVAELEAIARILEDAKRSWVASRLAACGYPPGMRCDINMSTGEITPATDV